jgi:hypothetical protein
VCKWTVSRPNLSIVVKVLNHERATLSRFPIDDPPCREMREVRLDPRVPTSEVALATPSPTMEDFVPQVDDIISVGEFYEKAAGGQIVFT